MRTVDGDYRNPPDAHAYQRAVRELERERDEALESSRRWEAEVMLYAANRDYQRGKREEAEAQVQTLRETLEAIASNRIGGQQ